MYSSVLIVDVLPVSGTSSFGEGCHLYKSLWKESCPLVTSMFPTLVNVHCINAIGCVTMGVRATKVTAIPVLEQKVGVLLHSKNNGSPKRLTLFRK